MRLRFQLGMAQHAGTPSFPSFFFLAHTVPTPLGDQDLLRQGGSLPRAAPIGLAPSIKVSGRTCPAFNYSYHVPSGDRNLPAGFTIKIEII